MRSEYYFISTFISQNLISVEICIAGDTQSLGIPALVGLSYSPFVYFSLSFTYFVVIYQYE